ncbi:MAG: hypothetical protein ACE5Q3_05290 [Alphaproteobacteria bacterium]
MTAPAPSPTTVDSFIEVSVKLSEVLEQEIDLLRDMRASEIEALQPAKQSMTATYARLANDLRQQSAALENLDRGRKEQLRSVASRLDKVSGENANALKATMAANQKMMQAIFDAVRQEQGSSQTYRRDGRIDGDSPGGGPPIALSLNKTL